MEKIINPWEGMEGYFCFGCAPNNESGLKMEFYEDGDEIVSKWVPEARFQGWLNTLHGGIQATLLDEICAWVIARKLQTAGVTSRMETQYLKPIHTTDSHLTLRGRIKEQKRNFVFIEAEIYNAQDEVCTKEELKSLHKLIKKVTGDIEQFSYNTSISAFMICVNELFGMKCNKKEILNQFIIVLAPFAPHVCEELWETLGNAGSVCDAKWPICNEEYLVEDTVNYTISFNGKARFNMEFPADAASDAIQTAVLADERSEKWMEGKSIVKVIVVPKKIVNIVVK